MTAVPRPDPRPTDPAGLDAERRVISMEAWRHERDAPEPVLPTAAALATLAAILVFVLAVGILVSNWWQWAQVSVR